MSAAPTLAPAVYNVVNREGLWRMVVNHHEFGSFSTEDRAIRVAIETAYEAGRFNRLGAVVVLHGANDMSRIVWTYGYDPFPPTQFE